MRPRSATSPSSSASRGASPSLLHRPEAGLEQVGPGRSAVSLSASSSQEGLDLGPQAVERDRVARAVERRMPCSVAAPSSSSREARLPAADVAAAAGSSPRRAARGRAARAPGGRSPPSQSGSLSGSSRCGEQLVLDEPPVRALEPALERVGAEHLARARARRAPAGTCSGPGQLARIREAGEQRRAPAASSSPTPSRASAASRSASQPPSASARASVRAEVASSGAGTARSGPRVRIGGAASRSSTSSTNGERASAPPSSSQLCQLR